MYIISTHLKCTTPNSPRLHKTKSTNDFRRRQRLLFSHAIVHIKRDIVKMFTKHRSKYCCHIKISYLDKTYFA